VGFGRNSEGGVESCDGRHTCLCVGFDRYPGARDYGSEPGWFQIQRVDEDGGLTLGNLVRAYLEVDEDGVNKHDYECSNLVRQ
jgi:hypothetical protein